MRCTAILVLVSAAVALRTTPQLPLAVDSVARQDASEEKCVEELVFHGGQTSAYSNLGGVGPDTDKPAELRFLKIGLDHKTDTKLDLVFRNESRYQTVEFNNGVMDGARVGQIGIAVGTAVDMTMSFFEHDTDTPVRLDLAKLTICDVDHFKIEKAEIYTLDVDAFYVVPEGPEFTYKFLDLAGHDMDPKTMDNETKPAIRPERFVTRFFKIGGGQFRVQVTSAGQGFGCDNPKDFSDLTNVTYAETEECQPPPKVYTNHQDLVVDQAKRCFAFELRDSNSTRLTFQAGQLGDKNGYERFMMISGASTYFNQEVECPETTTTLMKTTTTIKPTTTEEPVSTTIEATPAPTTAVTVTGDPHATNVDGQRFDIVRAGMHELLRLPRRPATAAGGAATEPLLRVTGRVENTEGRCEQPFVREVLVEGRLLSKVGSLHFSTNGSTPDSVGAASLSINGSEVGSEEFARRARSVATVLARPGAVSGKTGTTLRRQTFLTVWLNLGHVRVSIDWVHRMVPMGSMVNHLNFDVSNLRALSEQFGVDIGGLLGRDDHTFAATLGPDCAAQADLLGRSSSGRDPAVASSTMSISASL